MYIVYTTVKLIKLLPHEETCEVHTFAFGKVMSAGVLLLAAGTKGKRKIGIIFNTDPHYLDGSHWICMFIDTRKKYIFYFDSNADKTPKQINNFVNKIISQGNSIGINFND